MFKPFATLDPNDATCPGCGSSIPLDDINAAKDIALCRVCEKSGRFLNWPERANPPEWIYRIRRVAFASKPFRCRNENYLPPRIPPALLFLIPFTALWSGESIFGIYGTQIRKGHFQLFESMSGLPLLFGTIVLIPV